MLFRVLFKVRAHQFRIRSNFKWVILSMWLYRGQDYFKFCWWQGLEVRGRQLGKQGPGKKR